MLLDIADKIITGIAALYASKIATPASLEQMMDESLFASLFPDVRVTVAQRIDNQAILADLACSDADWRVRAVASARLESESVLYDVALGDDDSRVIAVALERLLQCPGVFQIDLWAFTQFARRIQGECKYPRELLAASRQISISHHDAALIIETALDKQIYEVVK